MGMGAKHRVYLGEIGGTILEMGVGDEISVRFIGAERC